MATHHPQQEQNPFEPLVRGVESAAPLDPAAKRIASAVRSTLKPGAVKDALSGSWLGHALHPLLTDVVVGAFVSASLLDLIGGEDTELASRRLITIGALAYGPTALSGFSDWADAEAGDEKVRRAGIVHATVNATALSMYLASLTTRRQGSRGAGVALSLAGASILSVGGFLGGHLSYRRGVRVDQTGSSPGPVNGGQPLPDPAPVAPAAPGS